MNGIAVLSVVWHIRSAVVIATAIELSAIVLRSVRPSARAESLDFAAALVLLIALTVVMSTVVFGSGRATIHRILGAIAIYSTLRPRSHSLTRMIDALGPRMFTSTPPMNHPFARATDHARDRAPSRRARVRASCVLSSRRPLNRRAFARL